jgi:Protein of unknown function (DUF2800)
MVEGVQVYLDAVRKFTAAGYRLEVEVKLNLGHLSKGAFGTGDSVLYHPKRFHLAVVDLKYGRGVQVYPEDNPQLLSYGSGANKLFGTVELISLVIVQPRASGQAVRQWDLTPDVLRQFEIDFTQAVKEASEPDAPLCAGGWCQFCPAAATCPEYRNLALRLAQAEFRSMSEEPDVNLPVVHLPDPPAMTTDELGHLLSAVDLIEDWIAAVKSHALKRALNGDVPTGHKLVRKNTLRRWVNEDKAAGALASLYDLDMDQIWSRKIISPAQAEKLIDKPSRAALHSLIMRPDGDATLAPLNDKRPAMAIDAKKEFDTLKETLHASVALLEHDDTKTGET